MATSGILLCRKPMICGTQRPGACSMQCVTFWKSKTLVRCSTSAGSSVSLNCSNRAWRCTKRACLQTHTPTICKLVRQCLHLLLNSYSYQLKFESNELYDHMICLVEVCIIVSFTFLFNSVKLRLKRYKKNLLDMAMLCTFVVLKHGREKPRFAYRRGTITPCLRDTTQDNLTYYNQLCRLYCMWSGATRPIASSKLMSRSIYDELTQSTNDLQWSV